jgi:hypothetical protein
MVSVCIAGQWVRENDYGSGMRLKEGCLKGDDGKA